MKFLNVINCIGNMLIIYEGNYIFNSSVLKTHKCIEISSLFSDDHHSLPNPRCRVSYSVNPLVTHDS